LAAVVLTWGMIPPGFEHSHAGGEDQSHCHNARTEVASDDAHHHHHHHSHKHGHGPDGNHHHGDVEHNPPVASTVTFPTSDVAHLHFRLFGFDFSMPLSETTDEGEENTFPPTIVRAAKEYVPTVPPGPSLKLFDVATLLPLANTLGGPEPVPRPPNLVASLPLCDSARLERTGVLRA